MVYRKILFLLILPFILNAQWTDPRPKSIQLWHLNTTFFDSLGNVVQDSLELMSADGVTITNSSGTFGQKVFASVAAAKAATGVEPGQVLMVQNVGMFQLIDSAYAADDVNVLESVIAAKQLRRVSHLDSLLILGGRNTYKDLEGTKSYGKLNIVEKGIRKTVLDNATERQWWQFRKNEERIEGKFGKLDSLWENNGKIGLRYDGKVSYLPFLENLNQNSLSIRSATSEQLFRADDPDWDLDQDFMIFIRFSNQVDSTTNKVLLKKSQSSSTEWQLTLLGTEAINFTAEQFGKTNLSLVSGAASVQLKGYYGNQTWHSLLVIADTNNTSNCKLYFDGDSLTLTTKTLGSGVDYSNTGQLIVGQSNQNFNISKLAIWKLGDGLIDKINKDALAKYLHNSNYDDLDFMARGVVYPSWIADSLKAYYTFNEGSGQYAYDQTGNGNDLTLGTTTGAEAADPTWLSISPDNPATIPQARPDSTKIMHIDFSANSSGWRQASWINIAPMAPNTTVNGGDQVFNQRLGRPEILVLDKSEPNDSLIVRYFAIPDGSFGTFRTNTMRGARSYDGGYTWEELQFSMVNGGTPSARELSSTLDSIRVMRNALFFIDDTVVNLAACIVNTGAGANDWTFGKTYMMKSGDYGDTWTDTVAVFDSVFHAYSVPSMLSNNPDSLILIGFSYDGNTGGASIGTGHSGVLRLNKKTGKATHSFIMKNKSDDDGEISWIMYDTTATKAVALARLSGTAATDGWWIGYTTDYGKTWVDSSSHYPDNKFPNPPRLFMMKNEAGKDSLIWQVHTNKFYYLDSVQTKIASGDAFTVQSGTGINSIWASTNWLDWERISADGTSLTNMRIGGSPTITRLDAETLLYTVYIDGSGYGEPYVVHVKKVLNNPSDMNYKDPRKRGVARFPGNVDGSTRWNIRWWGVTTSQTVRVLYPNQGVTATIPETDHIDFNMGHHLGGTYVEFEILD